MFDISSTGVPITNVLAGTRHMGPASRFGFGACFVLQS